MPGQLDRNRVGGRYVAASIGAHCAFLPLLTYLLPAEVEQLSDSPVRALSALLMAGAVTASIANIAAGRISDRLIARRGNRQSMAAAGLAATVLALFGFSIVDSIGAALVALLAFQVALNFLFAPLVAVLADHVPDSRKGVTAAWLNFALPVATLATAATATIEPVLGPLTFIALGLLVAILVLPFLAAWPGRTTIQNAAPDSIAVAPPTYRADFIYAWLARLFVQFGAAVVLSYLYLYVGDTDAGPESARRQIASLTFWATPPALAAGLALGWMSDRASRRRPALIASTLAIFVALLLMIVAPGWAWIVIGFSLFLAALTIFLALDSAMVAELLNNSPRRGWALGWMNLTNTLPAIAAPALTIGFAVVTPDASVIRQSLTVAAILCLAGSAAIWRIRSVA